MDLLDNVLRTLPELLAATPLTIMLTATAGALGLGLGTILALARLSRSRLVAWPAGAFAFAFRGSPLLVQLYLAYYGLGEVLPGTWLRHSALWPILRDGLWYAILVLSLNQAAYNSEVVLGAIRAVPSGQREAGLALGLTRGQVLRRVTLPQAVRACLPVLAGDLVVLLKSTSLASTVTVLDLMGTARKLQRESLLIIEPLIAAGLIYLAVVLVLTQGTSPVERRLARRPATRLAVRR